MSVLFMQTSDNKRYRPLLEITSESVKEYCAVNGCAYSSFLGLYRGYHAWQASYNRIPMLMGLLNSGYSGWACYLDADAFIADMAFDINAYLTSKAGIALIAAPVDSAAPDWRVNSGVFFVNFGTREGGEIVRAWASRFSAITDDQLREASLWENLVDDQSMLQHAINETAGITDRIWIERGNPGLINYSNGLFIRQVLRTAGTIRERAAILSDAVRKSLGRDFGASDRTAFSDESFFYEDFARACYQTLLLREPDPPGLTNAVNALRNGKSVAATIRSTLLSDEFKAKSTQFLTRYTGQP